MSVAEGAARLGSTESLEVLDLRRLHRGALTTQVEVLDVLDRAREEGVPLRNGVDRKSSPRVGHLIDVLPLRLAMDAPNISAKGQPQLYFQFDLGASNYFFAAAPLSGGGEVPLELEIPRAIYVRERRDLERRPIPRGERAPTVRAVTADGTSLDGELRDWSYQGMSIALPMAHGNADVRLRRVDVLDGAFAGESRFVAVRHVGSDDRIPGWTRVGVEASAVESPRPLSVERRATILAGGTIRRAWRRISIAKEFAKRIPATVLPSSESLDVEVATYLNPDGRELVGLVDRACGGNGGTAVIIPPAWGRTKETPAALASTLVSTFEDSSEPLAVLRFDGTNRRGESYVDPKFRQPGDEYLNFRFSDAVRDLRSSIDFARSEFQPSRIVLVTFSLGAIEGRRALVEDGGEDLAGWVSVVGMVDLQSGLRSVSGGVDFAYGQAKGMKFGRHELVGVISDMDHTGADAFDHGLVFLEDAKRDMAKLHVPVTWIHGKYDAWMDLERVQSLMSSGPQEGRRLIEIPSGHEMRSSREALETFQLVATQVMWMATGEQVEPSVPDLAKLERKLSAERARRPETTIDARRFWGDYLLGRDRRFGYELMSATSDYRELMRRQIELADIAPCETIIDIGSGTGDMPVVLDAENGPSDCRIVEIDLVHDAHIRARDRIRRFSRATRNVCHVTADLDTLGTAPVPIAPDSCDVAFASLVLSYVQDPLRLLRFLRTRLRPGGRLVVSSMCRDADISRIYVNALAELPPDVRRNHFGDDADDFDRLQRVFMNDASRLVRLEEEGRFRFWDADELGAAIEASGFRVLATERGFGNPPQASIVVATTAD